MLHFILISVLINIVLTASVIALMRMRTLVTEAQAEPVFAPANTTEAAPEAPEPVNTPQAEPTEAPEAAPVEEPVKDAPVKSDKKEGHKSSPVKSSKPATPKTNRKDGDRVEFIQVWNASSTGTMGWHSYEGDTTGLKWRNVIITWNLVDGKLKKNVSFEYPEGNKPAKKDNKTTKSEPTPKTDKKNDEPAKDAKKDDKNEPSAPAAPKSEPITKHSKDELLEAIKSFNGVTIYDAGLSVKVGKQEVAIREINSTNALLADGREIKLSAVPFSKAILENIIVACSKAVKAAAEKPAAAPVTPVAEQPAAEAPAKPAPKDEAKKDVQPMTDAEKAATEAAEALAKTLDNRNVATVTFTDSIIAKAVNKGVEREIEITGIRRHNGVIYMTCSWGKTNASYQLEKVGRFINAEVIRTMAKQVNAALGGRKNANARITIESAA